MQTSSAGRNRLQPDAGVTLLEVLVVLGILSMAYTLLSPLYGGLVPGAGLDSIAAQLAEEMRTLRSRAILSGQPTHLYILENGAAYGFSPDGKAQELPYGGQIYLNRGESGFDHISFFPDGRNSGFSMTVTAGAREKTIYSDWITGKIVVE